MAIRPIVRLGHPALRTPADPVPLDTLAESEFQTLIDDMFETMEDAGGVGLAAPQLGLPWQLFVYAAVDPDQDHEATDGDRANSAGADSDSADSDSADGDTKDAGPELKVLVNPGIEPESREMVYDWEGCLSIQDMRGLVPRYPAVLVHAFDRHGERVDFRAERYEARIIQHEFDHLNAIVFLDRMRDLRSLAFGDEWEEFMTDDESSEANDE